MWIAKPVKALSPQERSLWTSILASHEERGTEVPLSQTLAWAEAVRSYAVFSPQDGVGGILFSEQGSRFECVNGPLLSWDDSRQIPRQLATFAMAVSRLDRRFESLVMRPRWERSLLDSRLGALPIAPYSIDHAATRVIRLAGDESEARLALSSRFRRSLAWGEKRGAATEWRDASPDELAAFVPRMSEFARSKGFAVPPLEWFTRLVSSAAAHPEWRLRFALSVASLPGASASAFVALHGSRAHYLFGCEERRAGTPSAASPAGAAQWRAIRELLSRGIREYDLNGWVEDLTDDHPYAGVCRFKEQLGGECVLYAAPEFRVSL